MKDFSKTQDHADEEIKDNFKEEQKHYTASIQKIEVQTKLEKAQHDESMKKIADAQKAITENHAASEAKIKAEHAKSIAAINSDDKALKAADAKLKADHEANTKKMHADKVELEATEATLKADHEANVKKMHDDKVKLEAQHAANVKKI